MVHEDGLHADWRIVRCIHEQPLRCLLGLRPWHQSESKLGPAQNQSVRWPLWIFWMPFVTSTTLVYKGLSWLRLDSINKLKWYESVQTTFNYPGTEVSMPQLQKNLVYDSSLPKHLELRRHLTLEQLWKIRDLEVGSENNQLWDTLPEWCWYGI